MASDIFERLADMPVPPPPPPKQLQAQLHERLNKRLVARQLFDLLFRGMPYALMHLMPAVVYLIRMTVAGQCEVRRPPDVTDQAPPQKPFN